MSLKLFFLCITGTILTLPLVSCTGGADVVNPTVAQMDQLDEQWGLGKRRTRGTPQRRMQYRADEDFGGSASLPAPAMRAPSETINPAPPPSEAPPSRQVDPNTINSLR